MSVPMNRIKRAGAGLAIAAAAIGPAAMPAAAASSTGGAQGDNAALRRVLHKVQAGLLSPPWLHLPPGERRWLRLFTW